MTAVSMQPEPIRLAEHDRGYGWVVFAGIMLTLAGTVNLIDGIAAASGSHFFARHVSYLIGDLSSLGWAMLILGTLQVLAGFGVLAKNPAARWAGIVFAALNGVVQLLVMPAYPLWSLAIFAIDIAIMHGLLVYGGRTYRAA